MSASTGDKITDVRNSARPVTATVTGIRNAGGATLSCDALTGWPTASKVHFVTYTIDSNSDPVAGTQLDCSGIVSGSSITSLSVIDGNDTGNSVGDKVEMLPTAAWGQDLADALTSQHTRTGTHKSITTDTITITSGSTLPAGDIGTADIADASITNAKLATTAGELGGAWTSWTPNFSNWAIGSGGSAGTTARYTTIGKTIFYYIKSTLGTSGAGVTGLVDFSLPVTNNSNWATNSQIGTAFGLSQGGGYPSNVLLVGGRGLITFDTDDSGTAAAWVATGNTSATAPATWAAGDYFIATGSYEAA